MPHRGETHVPEHLKTEKRKENQLPPIKPQMPIPPQLSSMTLPLGLDWELGGKRQKRRAPALAARRGAQVLGLTRRQLQQASTALSALPALPAAQSLISAGMLLGITTCIAIIPRLSVAANKVRYPPTYPVPPTGRCLDSTRLAPAWKPRNRNVRVVRAGKNNYHIIIIPNPLPTLLLPPEWAPYCFSSLGLCQVPSHFPAPLRPCPWTSKWKY